MAGGRRSLRAAAEHELHKDEADHHHHVPAKRPSEDMEQPSPKRRQRRSLPVSVEAPVDVSASREPTPVASSSASVSLSIPSPPPNPPPTDRASSQSRKCKHKSVAGNSPRHDPVDAPAPPVYPLHHPPLTVSDSTEVQVLKDELAAKNNLLNAFMKSVTCSICLESMTATVGLYCGHTFCRSCLWSWLHRTSTGCDGDRPERRKRLVCPSCRSPIHNPPFPVFALRGIEDAFKQEELSLHHLHSPTSKNHAALSTIDESDKTWGGLFPANPEGTENRRPIVVRDSADNVERCGWCNWEIDHGVCSGCGARFDSYDDSDDVYSDEDTESGYENDSPILFPWDYDLSDDGGSYDSDYAWESPVVTIEDEDSDEEFGESEEDVHGDEGFDEEHSQSQTSSSNAQGPRTQYRGPPRIVDDEDESDSSEDDDDGDHRGQDPWACMRGDRSSELSEASSVDSDGDLRSSGSPAAAAGADGGSTSDPTAEASDHYSYCDTLSSEEVVSDYTSHSYS